MSGTSPASGIASASRIPACSDAGPCAAAAARSAAQAEQCQGVRGRKHRVRLDRQARSGQSARDAAQPTDRRHHRMATPDSHPAGAVRHVVDRAGDRDGRPAAPRQRLRRPVRVRSTGGRVRPAPTRSHAGQRHDLGRVALDQRGSGRGQAFGQHRAGGECAGGHRVQHPGRPVPPRRRHSDPGRPHPRRSLHAQIDQQRVRPQHRHFLLRFRHQRRRTQAQQGIGREVGGNRIGQAVHQRPARTDPGQCRTGRGMSHRCPGISGSGHARCHPAPAASHERTPCAPSA